MAEISFFLVLFLFSPASLWAQDHFNTTPEFQYLSKVDLPTVTSGDLNYQDLTIAIATGPDGNVYTLTFGKGVDKRDSQGNLLQAGIIAASQLDSPRDIAIDDQGYFYIADYLAAGETFTDNGKIRVFDPSGTYLPERTIFSSFYRPLGLDVKGDKIYAAEYYDGLQGPEKGSTFSRIRIYDKNSHAILKENENVELPIRIAVNSTGTIFVSQAGNTTSSVLTLDENLTKTGQLPGIESPGSVEVDGYDYVHVLEYGNRINFSDFINFESLALGDLLAISEQMMLGIRDEDFFVKVFNPAGEQVTALIEQIDFPVDLSFGNCENLYVDNADIFGSYVPLFGYTPSRIEFDLEIYKRNPTIDAAEAPVITCPGNIEVELTGGETFAVVDFPEATATDKCSVSLTQTQGLASGSQFEVGEHLIEYTAADNSGNIAKCSFTIKVTGVEDLAPQFSDCPTQLETVAEPGQCGAVVSFNVPVASDETGELEVSQIEGLSSGSFFEVGEQQIVFETVDTQGNRATCEFTVKVKDEEIPGIACPDSMEFTVEFGLSGKVVEFDLPQVADNCSGIALEQIEGLPSGSEFPVGLTKNTFRATDDSENSVTCSFDIIIIEESDSESPVISCPDPVFLDVVNGDCGQNVNYSLPEVTDNSGDYTLELITGPAPGEFFQLGATFVAYKAVDAAGNSTECSFIVTLNDKSPPVVTECPEDLLEVISTSEFILQDYRSNASFSDCTDDLVLTQDPLPGTAVQETSTITILAEDETGNISGACVFNLIIEKEELLITGCPVDRNLELDENCGATISDYTSEVTTNHSANISQSPLPGTLISVDTQITLTAIDENGKVANCSFNITLVDRIFPEITCPGEKQYSFSSETGFELPDYTEEISASDNCGFEISQAPPPGTVLFESQSVSFSVIDRGGNRKDCEFYLNLTEVAEPGLEITSCPSEVNLFINEDCQALIPDLSDEIITNLEAQITQDPAPGTPIDSNTTVEIRAEDEAGNFATCSIMVTNGDDTPPEISCGNDIFETIAFGGEFTLPDYQNLVTVTDCSENIALIQQPAPGAVITSSTEITLFAEDDSGNRSQECIFMVILQEEELEITNCPDVKIIDADANCSFILEDYTAEINTNHSAEIIQDPAPGTEIFESVMIEFRAQDENGSVATCSTEISLNDTTPPIINCPGDLEFTFTAADGLVIPDFRTSAEISENCDYEIVQGPAPGNVVFENTEIRLSVSDASGNSASCAFELILTAEETPVVEITTCLQEKTLSLEVNCSAQIPDLTSEINTNIEAQLVQNPAAGTVISENTSVEIKATDENGNVAVCTVNIILQDQETPDITCRGDLMFSWDPELGFVLPDFSANVEVSEICGDYTLKQQPAPGTLLTTETTEISFTAKDGAGNVSECSFQLILIEEAENLIITCPGEQYGELGEECTYTIPDFKELAQVSAEGAVITQNPAPGELITDDTQITLTAQKGDLRSSCSFLLSVRDVTPPEVSCIALIEFIIENNASVSLTPEDVETGSTDNCGIASRTLSKTTFTSEDVGDHPVIYTVSDASGNIASCEVLVTVKIAEDPLENLQCTEVINLQLTENRSAVLDPRSLFSGGTGTVQYSVSKEEFRCEDIGEQLVVFNYVTPIGEGSCEIKVIVEDPYGFCEFFGEEPADPLPFVIISPNPGGGNVQISTSPDITLNRAEVFDIRGRFLFAKDFSASPPKDYALNLSMFESGVYTIKLTGEEEEYIRRAIVRND